MTWHLKDRELEQKLIDIDCDFLEDLNNVVKDYLDDIGLNTPDEKEVITVGFYQNHLDELGELYFFFSQLEEVPEYNPNDWNEYPMVIPQTQRFMRLEVINSDYGRENTYIYKAQFKNGLWVMGDYIVKIKEGDHVRFRPWGRVEK